MINHKCSCCYPVFDGPTSSLKTCHGCGNQFFAYQAGGYVRQQPYYCVDCVEKNSVAEVIGHVDGLIKYNKPTGGKMKYGSDEFKEAVLDAKEYCKHSELAHDDTEELSFAKALIAIQEYAIFLENELTEEARINGQGSQRELKLLTKIAALEACIVEKDKTLNKFAEADKCITGASGPSTGTISYWVKGPNAVMAEKALSLTPESVKRVAEAKKKVIDAAKGFMIHGIAKDGTHGTLLKAILAELEALQRGEK